VQLKPIRLSISQSSFTDKQGHATGVSLFFIKESHRGDKESRRRVHSLRLRCFVAGKLLRENRLSKK
jgi:hypothetical protein